MEGVRKTATMMEEAEPASRDNVSSNIVNSVNVHFDRIPIASGVGLQERLVSRSSAISLWQPNGVNDSKETTILYAI